MTGSAARDKIKYYLSEYPGVSYREEDSSIAVPPSSGQGFEVRLSEEKGFYLVYGDGWHERFEMKDWKEAAGCFMGSLTSEVRVKVWARGSFKYRWIMERYEGRMWVPLSMTSLVFFPFWKPKRIFHLQNDRINRKSGDA